jgi:hypothetical protein
MKTTNQSFENHTNSIDVLLTKDQFKTFCAFIDDTKDYINDIIIRDGTFRSRTNDKVCIIESKFIFLEGVSLAIGNTRETLKLLSVLDKKSDINVSTDESCITFSDQRQEVRLPMAELEFCDNKFMSREELDNIYSDLDVNRPLVRDTINKADLSTLSKMTQALNSNAIRFIRDKASPTKGCLLVSKHFGSDYSESYTLKLRRDFLNPMDENHYFNVSPMPFEFKKADLELNFYFSKDDKIIFTIYHTSIGGQEVSIYGRAAYIEDQNDLDETDATKGDVSEKDKEVL